MKTPQQHHVTLLSAAQASIEIECNTEAALTEAACKLASLSVLQHWVTKPITSIRCCNCPLSLNIMFSNDCNEMHLKPM